MNLVAPPAIIMINPDINDDIRGILKRQLYINEIISGAEFDRRFASDGYYKETAYLTKGRVLVERTFLDPTNRDKMDLVLYFANGLLSIERTIFQSPPRASFPLETSYLSQLFQYKSGYVTNHIPANISLLPASPPTPRIEIPHLLESLLPRP